MHKKTFWWRFWEELPGLMTWGALILPVIFAFIWPSVVSIFIITFDVYWLLKALTMGGHLYVGYKRLKHDLKVDWLERLENFKTTPENQAPKWTEIYQAVILTTYREGLDVLENSIQSLVDSKFPHERLIFILATEERDPDSVKVANVLREKFGTKFKKFLVTRHPDGITGEVKAKGANATWAGQKLQEYLDQEKIEYDKVIVSAADADSCFHPQYLACVTWNYLNEPNRTRRSYQPIPIYSNNIWQVSMLSRIAAWGSSFWQMIEGTRPWRLINFSTHAMSMQTLVDIDFWAVDVVNEDSRQFWRAYFRYEGDHQVIPIFVPVYMDAVYGANFVESIKNQYLQKRRWAYGIEHLPYVVTESIKHKRISLYDRLVKIYRLIEGAFSWSTASIYIGVVGWLPVWFSPEFRDTVIAQNFPVLARELLMVTWIGLIVSVIYSMKLLPKRPPGYGKTKVLEMIVQWILIPFTAILFSSFPAIDAQTRLLFGKYLTFWTTPKKHHT